MTSDSRYAMGTEGLRGFGAVAMDLIRAPRNLGYMRSANGVGRASTHHCLGRIEVQLQVDPDRRRIRQARFVSSGCPTVTAALSLVTGLIRGWHLDRVSELSTYEILLRLGAVPSETESCVRAAVAATRAAALDYQERVASEETLPGHGGARVDPALASFRMLAPAE